MTRPRHYEYQREELRDFPFPFEVRGYRAHKEQASRRRPSLRHRWMRELHHARASLVRGHRRRRGHKAHHRKTR